MASAAAAALCVAAGANIVRMHNVGAAADAVRVADAILAAAPASGVGPAHHAPDREAGDAFLSKVHMVL